MIAVVDASLDLTALILYYAPFSLTPVVLKGKYF